MFFFFQAEDGIRDLVRSRGLGDVYKRQELDLVALGIHDPAELPVLGVVDLLEHVAALLLQGCLLYTSDAADERSSVDLGGRRIIKKKKRIRQDGRDSTQTKTQCKTEHRHGTGATQKI